MPDGFVWSARWLKAVSWNHPKEITRPRATLETAFLDIIEQIENEEPARVTDLDPASIAGDSGSSTETPGKPSDPEEN